MWDLDIKWDNSSNVQDGILVDSEKKIKDAASKRIIKNNEIHFIKAKALTDLCDIPKKNEQYRIITEKQFNAYALILSVIEREEIEELVIAIYRINQPTVESIIDFIEVGKIKKAYFVISNFFNQTKRPEKWAIKLKDFADTKDNVKHCYTHNHAKVILIKTKTDYLVFEGSGNMSDNARIEHFYNEGSYLNNHEEQKGERETKKEAYNIEMSKKSLFD
jgi:hypothetical protein